MQAFKYVLIICIFLINPLNAKAQEGIVGGIGATLELKHEFVGINARMYYGPTETFCFGPEVSFFPYQKIDNEYEVNILDLNLNAHYIFELNPKLGVYPLSGINYTIEKERLIDLSHDAEKESEIGLNYGLGGHYNLGKFFVFAEFKGVLGQLNAEFVTVGVIFGLSKKEE